MLASLYCFILVIFAWMAAYAEWPTTRGAAVCLGLLGALALLLGLMPLVSNPWAQGG